MKSPIFLLTFVLTIGITIGFLIQRTPEATVLTAVDNSDPETGELILIDNSNSDITELSRLMQREIKARRSLEQKLKQLNLQMSQLQSSSGYQPTNLSSQTDSPASSEIQADNDWFNEQALVDSGMTSSQAIELKSFFEQQELQQLFLRDQAVRESWDRQRYREEFETLNDEEDVLKAKLGDSAYDAYLYASGQSNRVSVISVLATAPAGTAGILAGDYILRYDNQRIYSGIELRQATTGGNATDSVSVQVERDGEILEFYLKRGPLGIRMNSASAAPRT
jgi:predicted metalloprotease with PDZ domain